MTPTASSCTRIGALSITAALLLGSCDAGRSAGAAPAATGTAGTQSSGSFQSLREEAQGGHASSLNLVDVRWGRRVDVWALDPVLDQSVPVIAGLVAAPDLAGLQADLHVDRSLATGREQVTILHARDSEAFAHVLAALADNLPALEGRALPSDATLSLRFDDLIDAQGLAASGIALVTSAGAQVTRAVELDSAHGVEIRGQHHSARLVLELDPAAVAADPTAELELQLGALANLAGRSMNAPLGAATAQLAGGSQSALGGSAAPFVVGRLPGRVIGVAPTSQPGFFLLEYRFGVAACAFAPQVGDVIETPGHIAQVLAAGAPPSGNSTGRLRVVLVSGDPNTFGPDAAELRARWDPALGAPPECFVRITPLPKLGAAAGVSPQATIEVTFSEPMLATSVQSTGSFRLAYDQPAAAGPLQAHVAALVLPALGQESFVLTPLLPLRHVQGQSESYTLSLADGVNGVVDLAGLPLENDLPDVTLQLDAAAPGQKTGSLSLSFTAPDEDGDGLNELRGQGVYDLAAGTLSGRAVTRFAGVVDPSQTMVSAMVTYPQGLQTPLVPLGSKQMSVWRYIDMGFTLLDDNTHNLDIEGLAWAPFGGVVADAFSEFRMAFAHSSRLPDEVVNAGLIPIYRHSGVAVTYDDNLLSASEDPLTVVHDKSMGYVVSPADTFVSQTGTLMQPWPLNRNIPVGQYAYWTWRDTGKLSVGGASSGLGADPQRVAQVGLPAHVGFYPQQNIPTIAEPLLSEFRCYPDAGALGLNSLRSSFAINSSYKPTFRAYSSGGIDSQGNVVLVDPDNEPVATGGYNPINGQKTGPIDNTVFWGQADFVVRVSRAHTRWLDTGDVSDFAPFPVAEPGGANLPVGTQVLLAYRGASSVSALAGQPWLDAARYDPYGDGYTQAQLDMLSGLPGSQVAFSTTHFPIAGDRSWSDSLDDIDGARYVQVRMTFLSNAVTGEVPHLAGVALAFEQ